MSRPSKDEYYLGIAKEVSARSVCFRLRAGAIIVKDDQIISTGYVGAPRKTRDCIERNLCLREKMNIPHGQRYELCRSVHSEMNAIINAARSGAGLLGGDMYVYGIDPKTGKMVDAFPCFLCKKMAINAGLKKIVCSTKDGGIKIFEVEDWVKDWQGGDILDDIDQYGADRKEA